MDIIRDLTGAPSAHKLHSNANSDEIWSWLKSVKDTNCIVTASS